MADTIRATPNAVPVDRFRRFDVTDHLLPPSAADVRAPQDHDSETDHPVPDDLPDGARASFRREHGRAPHSLQFATPNPGKVASLLSRLDPPGVTVSATDPDPVGSQTPDVAQDTGFQVDGPDGFSGLYTKDLLGWPGVDGPLRAASSIDDRTCRFVHATAFVDDAGKNRPFEDRDAPWRLADRSGPEAPPWVWSDLRRVFAPEGCSTPPCDLPGNELQALCLRRADHNVLDRFARRWRGRGP